MQGDIKVLNQNFYGTYKLKVEKRTGGSTHAATIKPGEPVEKGVTGAVAAGGNFAVLALTASPKAGTNLLLGVCKEESTETATVDGTGVFYLVGPGTRLQGKATTPANVNTVAKFDLLVLDCIAFDGIAAKADSTVTTPYTIDEDQGDDPGATNGNGLQMINCDILTGIIDVLVVGGTNFQNGGI